MTVEVVDVLPPAVEVVDVTPRSVQAMDVIAGPPGPPGPPSAGWLFEQSEPLASWTIPHPLGRIPGVQLNVDGYPVDAPCTTTSTYVYVTWPSPTAGTAILF